MTKISAVVPDELGAALKERARVEDRSMGAEIRRALTEHLQASPSIEAAMGLLERVSSQAPLERADGGSA